MKNFSGEYLEAFRALISERTSDWLLMNHISGTAMMLLSLNNKRSSPLRISSVNVTKSAKKLGFGHI